MIDTKDLPRFPRGWTFHPERRGKLTSHLDCYYCGLHSEKVHANGFWSCPNPLCLGTGASWFWETLKSYKKIGYSLFVDGREREIEGKKYIEKLCDEEAGGPMGIHDLEGKEISKIFVSEDRDFIAFESEKTKERFVFVAEGECYSTSWIEKIILEKDFLPASIVSVNGCEDPIREEEIRDGLEYVKTYEIVLKNKNNRVCAIVLKNSSNGYYGGSLEAWEEDYNRSTLVEKNYDGSKMREVAEGAVDGK